MPNAENDAHEHTRAFRDLQGGHVKCLDCGARITPPGDTYVCPTTGETESRTMGGFDVCCDHPECPGNTRVTPPEGGSG